MLKKITSLLSVCLILFSACKKNDGQTDLETVKSLAQKYNFTISSNSNPNSISASTIAELENKMQIINNQKNTIVTTNIDSTQNADTATINRKIKELRALINSDSIKIKSLSISSFGDPTYKYSRTIYFNNPGLLPNYAVTIQYNASNGQFTGGNVTISPYGGIYAAGNFSYFAPAQVYYYGGALAFNVQTSMVYSLNFPGVPFLGLSSTTYTQFNGWLQLDDNNGIAAGSGSQSPFDPDKKYQK